ncbi:TetR/AcrR family transcriptional regulator [Mycolicibacterium sp. F2034L]|uniref:TetR/AcrR family transcriptional regulator n=1 Tax=Mycolicibacterium sp. F2034L TaxID=2926422 RepID=UPI001FF29A8E|nr:TetR/AcrR family transcriptional regulator [Mycolicibacterium sp. F2034L]MCK0175270.1 TetR/AcrR family transcriptional regulator [Mycolicibacterium sp. F2034L]
MTERGSVEDRIGASTLDLLRSRGPGSVTVEAVAAASGVAKTTIYRRYSDRRQMLSDALSRLPVATPLDPRTAPQDLLRWLIEHAVQDVEDGVGLGGVASMLTGADPEFTALFRQLLVDRRNRLTAAIEAGKAAGALRADTDGTTLLDAIVGAYLAEQARTGGITDGWEKRLFDLFWPAVAAEPRPAGR